MQKKIRNFLIIQFIVWLIVGAANFTVQAMNNFPAQLIIMNALSIAGGGFLITTLYYLYIRRLNWPKWSRKKIMLFIATSTLITATVWLFLIFLFFMIVTGRVLPIVVLLVNLAPTGVILLLWFLVYFSYNLIRHYHKSEVERWKLKAEVQKAQLDILKLQVNPHFLFNTLNNIRALILVDQQRARQMLTNFSNLFRYSLQSTDKRDVHMTDEINIVKQYLELCKIQFEERLNYSIDVDADSEHINIPPMLIQMLVENAVKHGISESENSNNYIGVKVDCSKGIYTIDVKNSGELNRDKHNINSEGVGIKNINERLKHIYDDKFSFSLFEDSGYVIARIKIER
ncbi:MAG: histidine kinase [Bacteroidales bacterium]|jgi:sensor histidine kinase YesM|nr:histidine kinase [Bacteroidales bacterium]